MLSSPYLRFYQTLGSGGTAPLVELRAADLRLADGAVPAHWYNAGSAGSPYDAQPYAGTQPLFVADAQGGRVRCAGQQALVTNSLLTGAAAGTYPRLLQVAYETATPNLRSVCGLGDANSQSSSYLDVLNRPDVVIINFGFGQLVYLDSLPAATRRVVTVRISNADVASSQADVQFQVNEFTSAVKRLQFSTFNAPLTVGRGTNGSHITPEPVDVLLARLYARDTPDYEFNALHAEGCRIYL